MRLLLYLFLSVQLAFNQLHLFAVAIYQSTILDRLLNRFLHIAIMKLSAAFSVALIYSRYCAALEEAQKYVQSVVKLE